MGIVKFNHLACKYKKIHLLHLDRTYLIWYITMQVGFIFGAYTYLGFTDYTMTYFRNEYYNTLFFKLSWFPEFLLRSGFLFEILASFMLFARILHYPIPSLFPCWVDYIAYIYNKIHQIYTKYFKKE